MKRIVLLYICCLVAGIAKSQTDDRPWNIGLHGGTVEYWGDRGKPYYSTNQATYGFGGLSVSRYLSRHFDASLLFTRGEVGYTDRSAISTPDVPNHFLVRLNTANLLLRFNITGPHAAVRPYLFAGAGAIWYEAVYDIHHERFEFSTPTGGIGFNFMLGPVVTLQLQETWQYTTTDNIDHETSGSMHDLQLYHTAGLTFNLGKQKDSDGDGVPDKKDECPNTPAGVAVNKVGCPLDRDNDGVYDYVDACPDVAGLPALKGCPDKDMDGITDAEDRCPEIAGTVELKGCPDSDKDGVADIDDKCPGTSAGYKVDATGCPFDTDKDGIVNEEDKCPEQAGILAFQGCPDTDGDGVSDLEDRCPSVKGTIENKGCPEIPKEDIQRITLIAGKIYFETNSDKLKLISYSNLDDLVQILNRYPGVNLTIEGHTDDVGNDAYNQTLSQKRTESVKSYLESKGISGSRLTAVGYGKTRPIASNKTAQGRAKNRRVELKTSY